MAKAAVCFARDEFEAGDFEAGSFVRKWQGSVALDTLREDLRHYTKELKDRLYELINRDYADFVKISSKLAGVDEVVEVVAMPLRSIRDEVRTLNAAVASMRGDMEMAMASATRSRSCGALLGHCVLAVEAASLCQEILGLSNDEDDGVGVGAGGYAASELALSGEATSEHCWETGRNLLDDPGALLLARLQDTEALDGKPSAPKERSMSLFVRPSGGVEASTTRWAPADSLYYRFMRRGFALERAAHLCRELHSIMEVMQRLSTEVQATTGGKSAVPGSAKEADVGETAGVALESGALSLAAETLEMLRPLCGRLERECLAQTSTLFAASVNPQANPKLRPALVEVGGATDLLASLAPSDSMLTVGLQALLRGATRLDKQSGVEQLFQRLLLKRALEELLTPGQLDASGGRGRCKGLPKMLASLEAYLARAALPAVAVCEVSFLPTGDTGPDLLVRGMLAAVLAHFTGPLRGIFAPGVAEVLQANYRCVQHFLRNVCGAAGALVGQQTQPKESAAPQADLASAFERRVLSSEAYAALEAKWQLPVYLQLRLSDVTQFFEAHVKQAEQHGVQRDYQVAAPATGKPTDPVQKLLDEALEWDAARLPSLQVREEEARDHGAVFTPVARAFAVALLYLWREDVLLCPLVPQTAALSLALIGRFGAWAEGVLASLQASGQGALRGPEDAMMLQADLATLRIWGTNVFAGYAGKRAGEAAAEGLGLQRSAGSLQEAGGSIVEEAMREALGAMAGSVGTGFEAAVGSVSRRCCGALVGVRGISAAYRFTNKPAPKAASAYVGNILRPLAAFERDWASIGSPEALAAFRQSVAAAVLTRLEEEVTALMQSVKQMEDALQRRRQATPSKGGRLSDGDKIIMQMHLDITSLEEALAKVGVAVASDPTWQRIAELLPARH